MRGISLVTRSPIASSPPPTPLAPIVHLLRAECSLFSCGGIHPAPKVPREHINSEKSGIPARNRETKQREVEKRYPQVYREPSQGHTWTTKHSLASFLIPFT